MKGTFYPLVSSSVIMVSSTHDFFIISFDQVAHCCQHNFCAHLIKNIYSLLHDHDAIFDLVPIPCSILVGSLVGPGIRRSSPFVWASIALRNIPRGLLGEPSALHTPIHGLRIKGVQLMD
jgi:hypothetical protein